MELVELKDGNGKTLKALIRDGMMFSPLYSGDAREKMKNFRNLECREDDVFIASYPKCGRHWVLEITNMLLKGKTEFMTTYTSTGCFNYDYDSLPSPRIIASHFTFPQFPKELSTKRSRIIFITRNIKDAAVSYFNHTKSTKETGYNGTFDGFLPLFLKGNVYYGSWFDHLTTWESAMETEKLNLLHIKYEDMKKDLFGHVQKIANFLQVEVENDLLEAISNKCSFKSMSTDDKFGSHWKRIADCSKVPICRKGEVGNWMNWFTVAQNEMVDALLKDKLKTSKITFEYTCTK